MKNLRKPLWPALLAAMVLSMVSCDPVSSVEYRIYNKTADTVTVVMHKEILSSSYGGFAIERSDSATTHYGEADSLSVATLAPDQVLWVHREWDGLYREEQIIPLWKYIQSVKAGDNELPASEWDHESAWHLRTAGAKRFEGESRSYILTLRD